MVTEWQIGSANASFKQYVPSYQKTLLLTIKAQAAGGMSRGFKTNQFVLAEADFITFFQKIETALVIIKGHIIHKARCRCKLEDSLFFLMKVQSESESFCNQFISEYMIKVTMCIYQQCWHQIFGLDKRL